MTRVKDKALSCLFTSVYFYLYIIIIIIIIIIIFIIIFFPSTITHDNKSRGGLLTNYIYNARRCIDKNNNSIYIYTYIRVINIHMLYKLSNGYIYITTAVYMRTL